MSEDPILITGLGAATPLGNDYSSIANNLLAGRSGIRAVSGFPATEHPSRIAGEMAPPPCPEGYPPEKFARLHAFRRMTLWCAVNALRDAFLWDKRQGARLGIILGTATERNWTWEKDFFDWGGQGVYQTGEPTPPVANWLQETLGTSGPVLSLSAACASGNFALVLAKRMLQGGWVDYCLAGGADLALTPLILAGFGNLRALSRRNDDPSAASRPFDRDRDGFVLGEGGVLFLLEKAHTARRRGAHAYAEFAGHGAASDAHHMVIPSPDPTQAARAMREALTEAKVNPEEVDYVNAHATGTTVGDVAETRVLHTVFGPHTQRIPVSSTKSMTGHLLTAAAAFEALACIVALEHQALPPTINLDHPDPECSLCHIANQAQSRPVRVAVSNSFGFGGSNTSLVLRQAC